ncbi:hypothetical protein ACTID9_07580 [Brevibacillus fluminis]|uniref:hypothetical protein n=1 Tax=Brevibacillus fluminis TaxID=511487 RepID=UPI003F8A0074
MNGRAQKMKTAPQSHTLRGGCISGMIWGAKPFSFFAHGLAGIANVFRSTFLQKSLRCCEKALLGRMKII